MYLRNRQMGGIPLQEGEALALTLFLALFVFVFGYTFWFPFILHFLGIPEGAKLVLAILYTGFYIGQCMYVVPAGAEMAQLFGGKYTGVSFSAGICFLPRIPFPVFAFLLGIFLPEKAQKYLGWILEGLVQLESITVDVTASGLSSDGVRCSVETVHVYEIENAATYLSQTQTEEGKRGLKRAVSAECSSRIKQGVFRKHTARDLYDAEYGSLKPFSKLVTEECHLIEDFGLRLSRCSILHITIESKIIEKAFDAVVAKSLLRESTNEIADAFNDFKSRLPKDMSEEAALVLFNNSRQESGQSRVDMSIIKLK